jgi:hypothetical protein
VLKPLWYSTETYIGYNDTVDKWGTKAALRGGNLDVVSAAIALHIVFPDKTVAEIVKDLSMARDSAVKDSKEKF